MLRITASIRSRTAGRRVRAAPTPVFEKRALLWGAIYYELIHPRSPPLPHRKRGRDRRHGDPRLASGVGCERQPRPCDEGLRHARRTRYPADRRPERVRGRRAPGPCDHHQRHDPRAPDPPQGRPNGSARRSTNRMAEDTSIHWHGLLVPFQMDGVPGDQLSRHRAARRPSPIEFPLIQSGTYWYHSHSRAAGAARSLRPDHHRPRRARPDRVRPRACDRARDWSFCTRTRSSAMLKQEGGVFNRQKPTLTASGADAVRREGDVRPDADGPNRHFGRHRVDLHLSRQRPFAGRELDRPVHARASGCACGSSTPPRRPSSTCASRA